MPKMKYNDGTNWIELDANNGDSVNGIHFRENNGKIQYSTDNVNWKNAGAIGTATNADVLTGKTYSSDSGTELTGTMTNHGAVAITPSTGNQTRAAGYISGLTVYGNANLTAANIKKDVTIFGVKGNLESAVDVYLGSGGDGTLNTTANLTFPSKEHTDLIVKEYDSITINANHTVTVSYPCRGLVLYSKGNVTINGTIDMSLKAGFGSNSLPAYFIEKSFNKLVSDLTVLRGGAGGNGGGGCREGNSNYGGGTGGGGRVNAGGYGGGGGGGGAGGGVVAIYHKGTYSNGGSITVNGGAGGGGCFAGQAGSAGTISVTKIS